MPVSPISRSAVLFPISPRLSASCDNFTQCIDCKIAFSSPLIKVNQWIDGLLFTPLRER
jgi:hypothetical protein